MYGWQEFDLVLSGAIWAVAVVAWFFSPDRVASPDSCLPSRSCLASIPSFAALR